MTESSAAEKIHRFCRLVLCHQMPEQSLVQWTQNLPAEFVATTTTASQIRELAAEIANGQIMPGPAAAEAEGLQVLAEVDPGLRLARTATDCESFLDTTAGLHDAELSRLEYLLSGSSLNVPRLEDRSAWPVCILRFDRACLEAQKSLEVLAFGVTWINLQAYQWIDDATLTPGRLEWDGYSNVQANWIAWRWLT